MGTYVSTYLQLELTLTQHREGASIEETHSQHRETNKIQRRIVTTRKDTFKDKGKYSRNKEARALHMMREYSGRMRKHTANRNTAHGNTLLYGD